jgi:hypothetical protein
MLVHQIEKPWRSLIDSVLENTIGGHVRQIVFDRLGNDAGST